MNYQVIREKEKQFLGITSLTVSEFDDLLVNFIPKWEKYYKYHTLEGKKRKHPRIKEHGNALLKGTPLKLFFLLVYLKTNSLQEHQAASFGVSQSKVSKIIKILLSVLDETLLEMGLVPCRDGEQLASVLKDHQTKVFDYDGTERNIGRNTDQAAQEVEYSGKKHHHNIKNNLLCDENQYVHYLSPTELGSVHDITIAKDYPIILPPESVLRVDLGFIGLEIPQVTIEIPFKKPKGGELTFAQKLYNKMLSSCRVVVEHANSGVKRLKIVKEKIRIHSMKTRDLVMQIACSIHNLRVKSEERAYGKIAGAST